MTTTAEPVRPASTAIDPELRRLALVVLSGAIMVLLDTTIVVVAINELGHQFHTSLATIQWTMTAYLLALSMTIPLTRWAVERFGTKTVWLTSLVLFVIGSVLCGAAWSVGALIVFRIVQGIGGGLIMPVGQTMLARAAGPERMGRMMAVIALPAMIAPVLGPALGGLIVDTGSWRWMFFVNVPICAFAVVFAAIALPADTERRHTRLDATGLLLLSPGLAALVYGLSEAGKDGTRMAIGAVGGAALIAAFLVRSVRREQPLLDITLFRRRAFGAATAGMFAYAGAVSGLTLVLPLYYQLVRDSSPLVAGAMLAPLGIGAMIVMPWAGRLVDRRDARGIAVAGLLTMITGTTVYTQLEPDTSIVLLAGALFVVGLGHGMVFPSLQASAYGRLDRAEVPSGTTVANIVVRIGMSFGTAALAVVLQLYLVASFPGTQGNLAEVGRLTDPASRELLTHAFGDGLWWTFGIAVAALIPTMLVPHRGPGRGTGSPGSRAQPKRPEM
jgi:EmrB/QacA subfamily drug resistance transporter